MTKYFDEKLYYETGNQKHPETKFWNNQAGALKRYDAVIDSVDLSNSAVLDVGCGTGAFYDRVVQRGLTLSSYSGVDIVPQFVEQLQALHPSQQFFTGDIVTDDLALPMVDWSVAIGLFAHRQPDDGWITRFKAVTDRMWSVSRSGIVVTLTSISSPQRKTETQYVDPCDILCEARARLSHDIMLEHRYLPNDFLMAICKREK